MDDIFVPFPKISRLRRGAIITEKINGTNAQIVITPDYRVLAGSRNRWLEPGKSDNMGFAGWVKEHEDELRGLGVGRHYGEWWGQSIQKNPYGIEGKRFSLFNTGRWGNPNAPIQRPACCHVVPVIAGGTLSDELVNGALDRLRSEGSLAAPGSKYAEGIVTFCVASGTLFKTLLENDQLPKGESDE
jgi:hypothetical protein